MKIGLIGYGKMGQLIEKLAKQNNFEVVSTIDSFNSKAKFKEINAESVKHCEVLIDFTSPDAVVENIRKAALLKKNLVVGTTGWNSSLTEVKKIVEKNNVGVIYGSNFSIGVNAFFKIIKDVSTLFNKLDGYKVSGKEWHHIHKKDKPSGTAKSIEKIIKENIPSAKFEFKSIREGEIPGTHSVVFDSKEDSIQFIHTAKNREGFVLGALKAAKFIKNKKGFYSVEDMMKF